MVGLLYYGICMVFVGQGQGRRHASKRLFIVVLAKDEYVPTGVF